MPKTFVRTFVISAAALAACALAACDGSTRAASSPNASPAAPTAAAGASQRDAGAPIDHDAYGALGYRLSWRGYPIMSAGGRPLHFEVYDDAAVVQESGNIVSFLEGDTGRTRWSNPLGSPLTRFVGMTRRDEELLVASDTELYRLDTRTGVQRDRDRLAVVVNSGPTLLGDLAIFGSATGQILAHNLFTGYQGWRYALAGSIESRPVRVGELVGVVSQGGDVIVLNQYGSSTGRAKVFGGLANDPAGGDRAIYVASLDQSVYAFDAAGGRQLWRHRAERPITAQPVVHETDAGPRLYVTIPGEGLHAFDASSGELLWTSTEAAGRVVGVRDGRLIVWNADSRTAGLLDPETGDPVGSTRLEGVIDLRTDAFEDGALYLLHATGVVSKLSPKA